MCLPAHPVCHDEEGKWFRPGGGRSGRHDALADQERILVWPILASYAWIQLGSHPQGEHWLLCMHSPRGARRRVISSSPHDSVSFLHATRIAHLNGCIQQFVSGQAWMSGRCSTTTCPVALSPTKRRERADPEAIHSGRSYRPERSHERFLWRRSLALLPREALVSAQRGHCFDPATTTLICQPEGSGETIRPPAQGLTGTPSHGGGEFSLLSYWLDNPSRSCLSFLSFFHAPSFK